MRTDATDLVNAIGEGINNALALVGAPPLLRIPAPVTLAAPATEPAKADLSSPPLPSASAAVISTTSEPADAAPANETGKADVSQSVTPTRKRTRTAGDIAGIRDRKRGDVDGHRNVEKGYDRNRQGGRSIDATDGSRCTEFFG